MNHGPLVPTRLMINRRRLALEAIRRHFCAYGCAPSFGEIGSAIGVPPQRVSAIVRDLAAAGAIGFTPGRARSIRLPDPEAMLSTSELLLALQARGLLVQVMPAATAATEIVNTMPGPIVTELELSEPKGNRNTA